MPRPRKRFVWRPGLAARTPSSVFARCLARLEIAQASEAFQKSIELDPADPLPRLGLGLAMIRQGSLAEGREQIEIAVALDPANSLLRSYLGKAYFEENTAPRDKLAASQFDMARSLDPRDPTPWFYDAILKQTQNRPIEALDDLRESIALNDNRAVYRSRLLLDEDRAARSASLARIYDDLGFQQRALVEGGLSVNADPASDSAHRLLADTYSTMPRHDTARVSELLQSQLLQPLNVLPIQPQLGLNNSFIFARTGPADPGFGEWNSLFTRNGVHVLGTRPRWREQHLRRPGGGHGDLGPSLRQHWPAARRDDGFRPNNDLEENIYQIFAQYQFSSKTSVQVEYRHRENEQGDLPLRFDPDDFEPTLRQTFDSTPLASECARF